ncbi:MAG: response regulator receiver modulated diguanylate cyclase [uncultured bacterium]|nr:MAG: response regulator receiver modulated diguanylate cyclase [uncultured bacterium]
MLTAKNLNVLIAEDDADLRQSLQRGFERKGIKTLTASNGVEAMNIVDQSNVDAVITDIRMPHGDGMELIGKINRLQSRPALICMSGYSDLNATKAYSMGVDAFFNKPVLSDLLIEASVHFGKRRKKMVYLEQRFAQLMEEDKRKSVVTDSHELKQIIFNILSQLTALWGYSGMLKTYLAEQNESKEVNFEVNFEKINHYSAKIDSLCEDLSAVIIYFEKNWAQL